MEAETAEKRVTSASSTGEPGKVVGCSAQYPRSQLGISLNIRCASFNIGSGSFVYPQSPEVSSLLLFTSHCFNMGGLLGSLEELQKIITIQDSQTRKVRAPLLEALSDI